LACGLQKEARHEEAIDAFREAGRLEDSGTADFFHNYAVSLEAVRRFEEAADAYRSAAQLNPSDAEAWGNLGALLVGLGRWKDAAPCQERALRLAPSVTHALNLASTLYELNRLDEAERVLRDAVVLDFRAVDVRELLATVLAGQDRYDEAIRLARETCESSSGALSSRTVLACVLAEAGCLDEALRVVKAAVDIAPQDPRAHGALGTVYVKMNDGASALAAFERMADCLAPEPDRLPSSPWVSYAAGRGIALSLVGQHDDAMAAFEDVLRADPEFFVRWPEVAPHYQLSSREAGRRTETGHS
jgi:tetratricopeptide (TPR) repeat protein